MVSWEASVASDPSKTYDWILTELGKRGGLQFKYGQKQWTGFKSQYQAKIEQYDAGVTLVIRKAKDLPRRKSGLNRNPEAYCELKVGDQTFKTEATKSQNPNWNYSCHFTALPGEPLVFRVFDDNRNTELIGSLSLPLVPKDSKGLEVKSDDGEWTLILDVRRER